MAYRMIQVGTGSRGETWCKGFVKKGVEEGLIDVVAAADIDPDALENAKHHLGLDDDQCYTDAATAFAEHDADFCSVVVPPWSHEEIVDAALPHGLHILSEKPIADTLDASVRIAEKVERAGVKMGITMSHRFDRDKITLRRRIRDGDYGPLDYLVTRFTCDRRYDGNWGSGFRHEMDHPLLIEGSIHHLDFLASVVDADCERLYARTWKPAWAEYGGDCQALVTLTMENGVEIRYEGAKANAAGLNDWSDTYVRGECRDATVVLDHGEIERLDHHPDAGVERRREGDGDRVPLDDLDRTGDSLLLAQFVDWLDGGDPMPTNVEDNLQSAAIMEAAMRSSETGAAVDVQALLDETRREVRETL